MRTFQRFAIATLVLAGLISGAGAASFDCTKASTATEKAICQDKELNRLDEALAADYKEMMSADVGDGARQELRATQRVWVSQRNKCGGDVGCISKQYRSRLSEICEYPVLSGVHPTCYSPDEAKAAQAHTPGPVATHKASQEPAAAPAKAGRRAEIERLISLHAAKVRGLGFSKSQLSSTVYFQTDLMNSPRGVLALDELLSLLFNNQTITSLSRIDFRNAAGVRIKVRGAQPAGFLFGFSDGEAFITHVVDSTGEVQRLESTNDSYTASTVLLQLMSAGVPSRN